MMRQDKPMRLAKRKARQLRAKQKVEELKKKKESRELAGSSTTPDWDNYFYDQMEEYEDHMCDPYWDMYFFFFFFDPMWEMYLIPCGGPSLQTDVFLFFFDPMWEMFGPMFGPIRNRQRIEQQRENPITKGVTSHSVYLTSIENGAGTQI